MRAVTGVFDSLEAAVDAAGKLQELVPAKDICLLTPGSDAELQRVPTTDDMQDVGGIYGAALGAGLGAGTAALLPIAGPVLGFGSFVAALAGGAVGGTVGYKAGDEADRHGATGIPTDELHVYEHALERGQSCVIALVREEERERPVRRLLEAAGAHDIDAARHVWWSGIRESEAAAYEGEGGTFSEDEEVYREGFAAALAPGRRGRRFEDCKEELVRRHPKTAGEPAFRKGFERGQRYFAERRKASGADTG